MKAGKNFVIVFSTAAYELTKTVLADIFNSEEFSDNYAIQTQLWCKFYNRSLLQDT